jgi:hypothetical protein
MPRRREKPQSQWKLIAGISAGIIAAVLGLSAFLASQPTASESYIMELQNVSEQSRIITEKYEDSIGRWQNGTISDIEMLRITDSNLAQLEAMISRMKVLEPPEKFKEGHELSILSLEYELNSNKHLRAYVETDDDLEFERSTELLQLAFDYESKAFAAFAGANKN